MTREELLGSFSSGLLAKHSLQLTLCLQPKNTDRVLHTGLAQTVACPVVLGKSLTLPQLLFPPLPAYCQQRENRAPCLRCQLLFLASCPAIHHR